jgi:hypothetical protein
MSFLYFLTLKAKVIVMSFIYFLTVNAKVSDVIPILLDIDLFFPSFLGGEVPSNQYISGIRRTIAVKWNNRISKWVNILEVSQTYKYLKE